MINLGADPAAIRHIMDLIFHVDGAASLGWTSGSGQR